MADRLIDELLAANQEVINAVVAQRCAPLVEAADFLLKLKNGPRDTFYEMNKGMAWDKLRDALCAFCEAPS